MTSTQEEPKRSMGKSVGKRNEKKAGRKEGKSSLRYWMRLQEQDATDSLKWTRKETEDRTEKVDQDW